jgi:hypothetical protein
MLSGISDNAAGENAVGENEAGEKEKGSVEKAMACVLQQRVLTRATHPMAKPAAGNTGGGFSYRDGIFIQHLLCIAT